MKRELAAQPGLDIGHYVAGQSAVLQEVLSLSDLTDQEKAVILRVNAAG